MMIMIYIICMCGSTTKNLRIFTKEDWNQNLLREGGGVERYTVYSRKSDRSSAHEPDTPFILWKE